MNSPNARHIPWRDQMRRAANTRAQEIAWLAPRDVMELVNTHYLHAIRWLYECERLHTRDAVLNGASKVATDKFYLTIRARLLAQRHSNAVYGVLRANHAVEVCGFNAAGDVCHLIDHQTDRRMATYLRTTHERLHTQNLGAGALVFRLRYVTQEEQWKISGFVQTLPPHFSGGRTHSSATFGHLRQQYPFIGRDA